jgi:hypothetical protein
MGINPTTFEGQFGTTFGRGNSARNAANDRPKAEVWLNIGMEAPTIVDGEDSPRFISLPAGIPLDTMEHLPTNSRNKLFAEFQSARNDLHDQIMEFAKGLEPGQEVIIPLQVQLRRVSEEAPEISREDNSFGVKLDLAKVA